MQMLFMFFNALAEHLSGDASLTVTSNKEPRSQSGKPSELELPELLQSHGKCPRFAWQERMMLSGCAEMLYSMKGHLDRMNG